VQVMNYLVTALLPSEILPKLNFSEGFRMNASPWSPFPACS